MGAPENLVDVITGYALFLIVQLACVLLPKISNCDSLGRFAETGEALVSSVDKIIFVGSPGVGKMVCYLHLDASRTEFFLCLLLFLLFMLYNCFLKLFYYSLCV